MENLLAAPSWQSKQAVKGWGASLVLHACLVLAALGFIPKMAVLVQQEPFTWDVALIETPREVARPEEPTPTPQAQPAPPVKSQPARGVPPPSQPLQRQVESRVARQPAQREVQPVVGTAVRQQQMKPSQEIVQVQPNQIEPQEVRKPEPLVKTETPAEGKREVVQTLEQTVIESPPVAAQPYESKPVVSAPPVVETRPEPVVTASEKSVPAAQAAEASQPTPAPADPSPVPVAEAVATAASESVATTPAPVSAAQPDPAQMEEHQVVASGVSPKSMVKADNKWVGESLHRRISELRHYPSTARLNGWEGKVVLKVSIRNDGHLKGVEVVKSSGYESLDQAAIEAVRRACPLHMKHEMSSEMVVVHLPVNYSLNR